MTLIMEKYLYDVMRLQSLDIKKFHSSGNLNGTILSEQAEINRLHIHTALLV